MFSYLGCLVLADARTYQIYNELSILTVLRYVWHIIRTLSRPTCLYTRIRKKNSTLPTVCLQIILLQIFLFLLKGDETKRRSS